MVRVNGNMVPPLGQGPGGQGSTPVTFAQVNDKDGNPVAAGVGTKASGPRKPGTGTPGWPDSVSVRVVPKPSPNGPCIVRIEIHASLTATNCSQRVLQGIVETIEEGAKALSGPCPCPPSPPGMAQKPPGMVLVEVVVVWHDRPNPPSVLNISVKCGGPPVVHGKTDSGAGTIEFDGDIRSRGPAIAGHELGHVLFGSAGNGPPDWDPSGHSPDPTGLMRDTMKPGGGGPLVRDETASEKERCKLAGKAGDLGLACCYGPIPHAVVLVGGFG